MGTFPNNNSGAWYPGVPTRNALFPEDTRFFDVTIEHPKSPSLQTPLLDTNTLAGFTSKCKTPFLWQWAKALVTWNLTVHRRQGRKQTCLNRDAQQPISAEKLLPPLHKQVVKILAAHVLHDDDRVPLLNSVHTENFHHILVVEPTCKHLLRLNSDQGQWT